MLESATVRLAWTVVRRTPAVEVEETVATCDPPGNGAGPLWCYGAPLLFRLGDTVFVSAMETGEGVPPLCNTRWRLFRRSAANGWELVRAAEAFREREPCPLVGFEDGRMFLCVNPSTRPPGTQYGPCDPHLLEFSATEPTAPPPAVRPIWAPGTQFTDHSYRGIAADGQRGELLLLNIHAGTGEQFWAYRDASGGWSQRGTIRFPIRSCYPQVALRAGAAHVLAIGDIVEPVEEWRRYKFEQTGRQWDYVFRRLFYTWTPDISAVPFAEPVEVDTVEATAGHISNLDLWLDGSGGAHVLYRKNSVQSALLRDRFFPGVPLVTALEHVVMRDGGAATRHTLRTGGEGSSPETPGFARFHATPDGRLFAVYRSAGAHGSDRPASENCLLEVCREPSPEPTPIPLQEPFTTFFTATERGGSPASDVLDLYGVGRDGTVLRYARVR
jgi:hypothetical protein